MSLDAENVPRQASSRLRWASLLAVAVAGIMWAGIAVLSATGSASFTGWENMVGKTEAGKAENLSEAFRTAAKRVLSAVVVIKSSNRVQTAGSADSDEHFAWPGLGHTAGEEGSDWQHSENESEPVLGSGVVIDAKGIVLTNNHVVEGADELVVRLADGRQFPATIERTDAGLDLAVLRVQCKTPLPAAHMGDSDKLEIGDWVLAIGSPFELEQTVSAGIISAKGRSLDSAGSARLLQTDAAINPGSSGGPLVNLAGEVVGITTAIASRSGGYQGIAFAVPSNLAAQLRSSQRDGKPSPPSGARHSPERSRDQANREIDQ